MSCATHNKYMRIAVDLADRARSKGNHPFGAILVCDGEIILKAENTVISDRDATRHAELNLVSDAARQFEQAVLERSVLYSSTEPCPMCAAAIYWTGIRKVIYGCPTETLAALAGGSLTVPCREVFARGVNSTEIFGPILEAEAKKSHEGFWMASQ
ncbi:MAG: hypothetical protein A2428_08600 [Bdellovibrionales bacterium RIFOXYC1_FULL_54_43]|nr:MAG: hypothetical protein A2428_08600 [Bdellovibrionales bacterium RIFOXYC1_FULL_54_43]OFZ84277.1 MAG: hypothetical protein A2603_15180 [Bdellovibrionales bacterium RIFOXYD1_FULL_55_31]